MSNLQEFIKQKPYLIWYVKDFDRLSEESIVEHVLNYGDWDDVQTLIKIAGIKKVAEIFRKQTVGPRLNYYPQIVNYFKLYFNEYAK